MEGYIRLNRKFFENNYWLLQRSFSLSEAWLDLIQLARFEADPISKTLPNGRQIRIERGEIHASLRFLSNRWSWGVDKTRRYIDNHKKKNEIEHRIEQGESVIKLCNYETYNPLPNIKPNTKSNSDQTATKQIIIKGNKKKEISSTEDIKENPRFEKFKNWLKDNCPSVYKMESQITETQFLKLLEAYSIKEISDGLETMDNSKTNNKTIDKRYKSVYRTFLNWNKK